MLVMHYRIKLGGDRVEAAAAIRRRVAERGHLFDGMQGLARKFFLLDAADPTYATLYLWRDADAALAFLQGPFFAAVIELFGRPAVRLLLSTAIELPGVLPTHGHADRHAQRRAVGTRIEAVDPLDGTQARARFRGRRSRPPLRAALCHPKRSQRRGLSAKDASRFVLYAAARLTPTPMSAAMSISAPKPFALHVPDADIADLRERLARTRWPDEPPHEPWSTGTSLSYMRGPRRLLATGFDWRQWEGEAQRLPAVHRPRSAASICISSTRRAAGPTRCRC